MKNSINLFMAEGEMHNENQNDGYGAKSPTEYRVTSIFKGSNSSIEPFAYSVTKGKIFIIEQNGKPDRINLFLRPEENIPGLPCVKYFVYRGLLKKDFLDVNNGYQTIKPEA